MIHSPVFAFQINIAELTPASDCPKISLTRPLTMSSSSNQLSTSFNTTSGASGSRGGPSNLTEATKHRQQMGSRMKAASDEQKGEWEAKYSSADSV